jgi:hypothetical protein
MGDCVLDLCCGSGDLAFLLSEKVGSNGGNVKLSLTRIRKEAERRIQELEVLLLIFACSLHKLHWLFILSSLCLTRLFHG